MCVCDCVCVCIYGPFVHKIKSLSEDGHLWEDSDKLFGCINLMRLKFYMYLKVIVDQESDQIRHAYLEEKSYDYFENYCSQG